MLGQVGPDPQYTNGVQMNTSPWDFAFAFQLITPIGNAPDGSVVATGRIVQRIVMSPTHAKAFLGALTKTVEQWETSFGPIPELQVDSGGTGA